MYNKRKVLSMTLLGYPQSMITTIDFQHSKATSLSIFSTISLEKAVLLGHFVLWLEFFTVMYCYLSKHYSCYTNHQVLHSTVPCSTHRVHLGVKYVSQKWLLLYKESNDWFCINMMMSVFMCSRTCIYKYNTLCFVLKGFKKKSVTCVLPLLCRT